MIESYYVEEVQEVLTRLQLGADLDTVEPARVLVAKTLHDEPDPTPAPLTDDERTPAAPAPGRRPHFAADSPEAIAAQQAAERLGGQVGAV